MLPMLYNYGTCSPYGLFSLLPFPSFFKKTISNTKTKQHGRRNLAAITLLCRVGKGCMNFKGTSH